MNKGDGSKRGCNCACTIVLVSVSWSRLGQEWKMLQRGNGRGELSWEDPGKFVTCNSLVEAEENNLFPDQSAAPSTWFPRLRSPPLSSCNSPCNALTRRFLQDLDLMSAVVLLLRWWQKRDNIFDNSLRSFSSELISAARRCGLISLSGPVTTGGKKRLTNQNHLELDCINITFNIRFAI